MLNLDFYRKLQTVGESEGVEKFVVGGVVANPRGDVLILRRTLSEAFLPGLQEIPSGNLEQGEGLLEGLKREVWEETGLKITQVEAYFGHFDYMSESNKRARQFNFSVQTHQLAPIVLNAAEHDAYEWMRPAQLEASKCSAATRGVLQAFWLHARDGENNVEVGQA